jgi:lysophospholipase L1-like esterase
MTNAGKPGEWAVAGAERIPGVLTSVRPEVVLLLEGYNDPLEFSSGMNAAVSAIDTMAKEARFRGARVFIASLTPGRPGGSHAIAPSLVMSYNSRLRTVAEGERAVFVDLFGALSSDVNTYIGIDGLHPTEAGYRRMADTFFAAIRADLEVK